MDLNDSKPQVYLSELNYQTQYFAISHVWSDGLGNRVQNGIRRCQAARLQSILKKAEVLYDGKGALVKYEKWAGQGGVCLPMRLLLAWKKPEHRVYFWLDTLCVPTGDEAIIPGVNELKRKAIKHITPIFSGASAVVILDSELQKIGPERNNENGRVDDEVLAAHVLATKWMQRAWTLEEGSLARKCFFTVGDTLQVLRQNSVVIDPLGRRICDSFRSIRQNWKTHSPLDYAIARFKNGIPRIVEEILSEGRKQAFAVSSISQRREQLKKIRVKRFVHSWNNLLRRTTTEAQDMQRIFANILDFNASSISKYHPGDGLVAILRSCEELPLSLLYNGGPRLQDVNAIEDAWIPTSINGLPLQDHGILQRTTSGFKIVTTGVDPESINVWITEVKVPFQAELFGIRDSNTGQQYVVEKQMNPTQGSVEFGQKMQDSYESAMATCIIMDKRGGSTSSEGYSGRGALFSVCEIPNSDQNIQVRFNSPLRFWALAQWQQNVLRYNPDPYQMPCFPAQHLKDDQNILLQLAPFKWDSPFPQRPLLIRRTNTFSLSQVIAVLGGFAVMQLISDVFYTEDASEGHRGTRILIRFIFQFTIATLIVRALQYRSKRAYQAWLATYEESWRPDDREWRKEQNTAADLETGELIVFGASAMYAHNEYELGMWRREIDRTWRPYFSQYLRNFPPSEPVVLPEIQPDRLARFAFGEKQIYDDMCYLIDKYPPISLGEQPTKSGFAAAATGVVISISG
ncbi:hypothetical protein LPUS_10125 [Lasallia pustulata]|uniref:Heterokaryon incompatibility domain-containing protein n=1 Tax=Lasallia pustulata TaxID=136370 RepID=A0A1W5D9D7_9LECA|nr:hypothetical protein LPUS_10125 [Lasallia pustulata]